MQFSVFTWRHAHAVPEGFGEIIVVRISDAGGNVRDRDGGILQKLRCALHADGGQVFIDSDLKPGFKQAGEIFPGEEIFVGKILKLHVVGIVRLDGIVNKIHHR